jgi:hypothetical protein
MFASRKSSAFTSERKTLSMAAKHGSDVLFCMPNRTKCILLVSVLFGAHQEADPINGCQIGTGCAILHAK